MMAEAYGKLTGRTGVCMVTRGPGRNQRRGRHPRRVPGFDAARPRRRGRWVEGCWTARPSRRWTTAACTGRWPSGWPRWTGRSGFPEYVSRAFHTAASGRGPRGRWCWPCPRTCSPPAPTCRTPAPPCPGCRRRRRATSRRSGSSSPSPSGRCSSSGAGAGRADAARDLARFSTAHHVPVSASFRCQDYIDNRHPNYCGHAGIGINPRTAKRFRECDLLIALGTRLGEITTSGYSLVDIPNPASRFVHVHPGAEELGRVYRPRSRGQRGGRLVHGRARGSGARRRRCAPHLDAGVRGRIPDVDGAPFHPPGGCGWSAWWPAPASASTRTPSCATGPATTRHG